MGLLASCYDTPHDVKHSNSLPTIYPDYTDVVIPENIAPLNFLVKDADAVEVKADDVIVKSSGEEVVFDEKEWKDLLAMKRGKDINVTVTVRKDGAWTEYKSFKWHVADCKIDAWLSYRLIEPSGTIYSRLRMMQRSLESFEEAAISDYHLSGNRCVNCHIPGAQNSNLSMMYLRGENGGAVLNQGGKLRKLNLKTGNILVSLLLGGTSFSHVTMYGIYYMLMPISDTRYMTKHLISILQIFRRMRFLLHHFCRMKIGWLHSRHSPPMVKRFIIVQRKRLTNHQR